MDQFHFRDGELFCEGIPLESLGRSFGTPLFVYSTKTIRDHVTAIHDAFTTVSPLVCYAVKANSNLALLKLLHSLGCGFDIVSVGELERVLRIGAAPKQIVFSGVGKRDDEMAAAIKAGVLLFNVESEAEAGILGEVATRMEAEAHIAIRVNPDVDPKTHRYIATGQRESKFGVDLERAPFLGGPHPHPSLPFATRDSVSHREPDHQRRPLFPCRPACPGIRLVVGRGRRTRGVDQYGRRLRYLLPR